MLSKQKNVQRLNMYTEKVLNVIMCTTFEISKVKRAKWLQIISAKKKKKASKYKKKLRLRPRAKLLILHNNYRKKIFNV